MSMTKDSWLAALADQATQFRAAVTPPVVDSKEGAANTAAAVNLQGIAHTLLRPVPSCPDWNVHDLICHLGNVYQRMVGHLERAGTPPTNKGDLPAPAGDAVLGWWDERLAALQQALRDADPDAPAWNPFHAPPTAVFFHRRAAHETAVHRWDAQLSVSLPDPIDPPEFAADGVHEALDLVASDITIIDQIRVTGVARLVATDIDAHWVIRIRENGVTLLDTNGWFDTEPEIAASAEATASDLLLLLWGRVPISVTDSRGETLLIEQLRVRR